MHANIKVIAFDADDTLWANEGYFQEVEQTYYDLMAPYASQAELSRSLHETILQNLPLYGYGTKGFILSLTEAALVASGENLPGTLLRKILELGKRQIDQPVELLDGVEEVLSALRPRYRLVLATKGDLLDQERKLRKSGLMPYFHHIEIMSEKDEGNYTKLIKHLDINASELLMIGNSLKSDVLPVLKIGGYAIHVPYHITWAHEMIDHDIDDDRMAVVANLRDVLKVVS
ncbi:HAD family hydrolase [Pedobacter yulinensis]|uniref:HAD family hydrolase n=1 Tax=Pedobacter yulinensis TaxID=2126353 RepID=A0A2T3HIG4_9SPHI|nr:HAD family hydrolase [Pedobacter yulinensis]PST82229.1 HAD family hydrolase [Pedobacter yulinensis]